MGAQPFPTIPHSWPPITKSQALLASGVYNQGNQSVQDIICLFLNLQTIFQFMFLPQSPCCGHVVAGPSPLPGCSLLLCLPQWLLLCSTHLRRLSNSMKSEALFLPLQLSLQVCLSQKPCSASYVRKVSLSVIGYIWCSEGTEPIHVVDCLDPGLAQDTVLERLCEACLQWGTLRNGLGLLTGGQKRTVWERE